MFMCECSWVTPCAASISLQPRPRALLLLSIPGLSSCPHPAAWPHTQHAPHRPCLSTPPTKPTCPLLTAGELLQIGRQKSCEWKIFSSLSYSISVQWRAWSPLTETAKFMEHLEDAVGVKRLNLALWARFVWPIYVCLGMVHLNIKENRINIWIFQSRGT